eukprot:CAMPEP_0182451124 /NCGR_PEP_ID=MMETSP1172-20130603/43546_1 /TAXON_ID=708627 /ORGANISM="Timspurckia oligopyrenoides, Strain CCMP3278" /LENGTH=435 /DNA_ID=CAMNT_0024648867 /DNA_START=1561 /DNA_END=2868 /DNA_ORIENTATION=+
MNRYTANGGGVQGNNDILQGMRDEDVLVRIDSDAGVGEMNNINTEWLHDWDGSPVSMIEELGVALKLGPSSVEMFPGDHHKPSMVTFRVLGQAMKEAQVPSKAPDQTGGLGLSNSNTYDSFSTAESAEHFEQLLQSQAGGGEDHDIDDMDDAGGIGGDSEEGKEEPSSKGKFGDAKVEAGTSAENARSRSVAINRRYRSKVQNSIAELQAHLELRRLCPFKRKLSRAEAATRSLSYIKSLEKNVERMRRACELAFIIQNPEMTRSFIRDLYHRQNYDQRRVLTILIQDLLHVFDFSLAELWKKERLEGGREELTYWFGARRLCLSSEAESLLNMFEITSERMKFAAMEGLPGRTLSMRQSQYLPQASDTGQFIRAKQAQKAGIQSGYAFPVMAGEEVTSVAVFLTTEKRDFNFVLFNAVQSFFSILSSLQTEIFQ